MSVSKPGHCLGCPVGVVDAPCDCLCFRCRSYSHQLTMALLERVRLDFDRMAEQARAYDHARTLARQGRPRLRLIRGGK